MTSNDKVDLETKKEGLLTKYTVSEVAQHKTVSSLWIILDDHVFDITKYIFMHSGGSSILLKNGGTDCTKLFNEINHVDATHILDKYLIGIVEK